MTPALTKLALTLPGCVPQEFTYFHEGIAHEADGCLSPYIVYVTRESLMSRLLTIH